MVSGMGYKLGQLPYYSCVYLVRPGCFGYVQFLHFFLTVSVLYVEVFNFNCQYTFISVLSLLVSVENLM